MTNRELDNAIAVMQAYKDGKTIQVWDDIEQQWFDAIEPSWDFGAFVYRVKPDEPKPHYRPFKSAEEVLAAIREHGMLMYIKRNQYYTLPANIHDDCIQTNYTNGKWGYSYAMEICTFADGTPFGKSEE